MSAGGGAAIDGVAAPAMRIDAPYRHAQARCGVRKKKSSASTRPMITNVERKTVFDIRSSRPRPNCRASSVVDNAGPAMINFYLQRMTTLPMRKKKITHVVEYDPYLPTLARLLEEGHPE